MTEMRISHLNLSAFSSYGLFRESLEATLEVYGTANKAIEQLGAVAISEILLNSSPDAYNNIKALSPSLNNNGVAVLHDTGIESYHDEIAQLSSICISSIFGTPTKTDKRNSQVAWPIRYDPGTTVTRTFSQSLGEAAFHTDTQYYPTPEKYFGLFCIIADLPGKGTNNLLSGESAVESFKRIHGSQALQELLLPFPFRVPSVFTETVSDSDIEITWAPIYDPSTKQIRYRKDTILKALEDDETEISIKQEKALLGFDSLLGQLNPISYHLEPGDAILVNNHSMLHARTNFDNPNRFLYRVRMDDDR